MTIIKYIVLFIAILLTFAIFRTNSNLEKLNVQPIHYIAMELLVSLLWVVYFMLNNN